MVNDGNEGPLLLLAHGAGAPMDSDAMSRITAALVTVGFRVGRFEFPYMVKRRQDGRKRPPDGMETLLQTWRDAIAETLNTSERGERIFIGGKSMGGRMASRLLAEDVPPGVAGGMVFGYPFHPPGRSGQWRVQHFPALRRPLWIAQGERDPFGKKAELSTLDWESAPLRMHWASAGNHDFVPTKRSGLTRDDLLHEAALAARTFARQCLEAYR